MKVEILSLKILNNPIFSTIQDLGRIGFMHTGVSNSGASDEFLFSLANKLLRNDKNSSMLEISMGSFEAKFLKNTKIIICGYIEDIYLDDKKIVSFKTLKIRENQVIKIKNIPFGKKVYLALKHGFNITKTLGSASSSLKEHLGLYEGRKLKKDDSLDYLSYEDNFNIKYKGEYLTLNTQEILTLRVVLSYQYEYFSTEEKKKFFNEVFTINNDFNTMACRLDASIPIKCEIDGIISEGISFGSVQIPKNGMPIILLKNRQTIGGYPKIATVLGIDCFKLSQCAPKQKIKFEEVSLEDAIKVALHYNNAITNIKY
jgi:biotin-dependent carboxylase-like uncharacterized protein